MQVFFEPSFSYENDYVENVISGLKHNGVSIINEGAKGKKRKLISLIQFLTSNEATLFHVNWIENIVVKASIKSFILQYLWFMFVDSCHLIGKKFAWTMHNIVPHGCENLDYAERFYLKWSNKMDVIVVHCNESKELLVEKYGIQAEKICVVPHGGYSTNYTSDEQINSLKRKYNIRENDVIYLFFGQIDDYKNIPLLIEVFEEAKLQSAKLLVCGKFSHRLSTKNRLWLETHQYDERIFLDNRFIPDEEISLLFQLADTMVLPYDKTSMQNSGVAILALCNGTPLLIPNFGYIKDINDQSFVTAYDYENFDEHRVILKQSIVEFYKQYNKILQSKIRVEERNFAIRNLDWNNICSTIVNFYAKATRR